MWCERSTCSSLKEELPATLKETLETIKFIILTTFTIILFKKKIAFV